MPLFSSIQRYILRECLSGLALVLGNGLTGQTVALIPDVDIPGPRFRCPNHQTAAC